MNWTGGRRHRADKAFNGAVHKQKQFFAKVRAEMTAAAFMQASTSHPGTLHNQNTEIWSLPFSRFPSLLNKREKAAEFNVVGAKHNEEYLSTHNDQRGQDELLLESDSILGKRKNKGPKLEKEAIKRQKRRLLDKEDWVCTTVAAPIKKHSPKKRQNSKLPPPEFRSYALPELRENATYLLSRTSQTVTELDTEYAGTQAGLNAFETLSHGGYVKIGKGRRQTKLDKEETSDCRGAFGRNEIQESPKDSMLRDDGASETYSASLIDGRVSQNDNSEVGEDSTAESEDYDWEDMDALPTISSQLDNSGKDNQLKEIQEDTEYLKTPQDWTPVQFNGSKRTTPSSPTLPKTHFVSNPYGSDSFDDLENYNDLGATHNKVVTHGKCNIKKLANSGRFKETMVTSSNEDEEWTGFWGSNDAENGFIHPDFNKDYDYYALNIDNQNRRTIKNGQLLNDDISSSLPPSLPPALISPSLLSPSPSASSSPSQHSSQSSPSLSRSTSHDHPDCANKSSPMQIENQKNQAQDVTTDKDKPWRSFVSAIPDKAEGCPDKPIDPQTKTTYPLHLEFTEEESRAWRDFVFSSVETHGEDENDELFFLKPSKPLSGKHFTDLTATSSQPKGFETAEISSISDSHDKGISSAKATYSISSSSPAHYLHKIGDDKTEVNFWPTGNASYLSPTTMKSQLSSEDVPSSMINNHPDDKISIQLRETNIDDNGGSAEYSDCI
jgi:hypothetical protein